MTETLERIPHNTDAYSRNSTAYVKIFHYHCFLETSRIYTALQVSDFGYCHLDPPFVLNIYRHTLVSITSSFSNTNLVETAFSLIEVVEGPEE